MNLRGDSVLDLLDNLSSENLVMICFILGTIALVLAILISIEIYMGNKKYKEELDKSNTQTKLNIKEDGNIKYVEDIDRELEKTKAKMELQELRDKLKKEEEEKKKLLDTNLALASVALNNQNTQAQVQKVPEIEKLEDTLVDLEPIKEEKLIDIDINKSVEKSKEELVKEPIVTEVVENKIDKVEEITKEKEYNDEEDAIISYEELKNAKNFGYTDEEMENYVDEQDAIISMQELEKLYYESQKIEVSLEDNSEEYKTVKDLPEIRDDNNFKASPYISPVYGKAKTDQDLMLEQTANLEKLNEEIKKTNEFLKMLKDLKKNLE